MTQTNSIQCVIFDCDGTLIDSEKLCLQAICDTMADLAIQVDFQWLKAKFQGTKIHIVFEYILDIHDKKQGQDVEALIVIYRQHCNRLFEAHLQPLPGVREVIKILQDNDIAIGIASNAPMEKMDVTLEITDLKKDFLGHIYSAFDANSWKPEPQLLHYVMANMGYTSEQCLFIDDSLVGVEAGVKAGIKTLYFTHDALSDENPHQVDTIEGIEQCLHFIDGVQK